MLVSGQLSSKYLDGLSACFLAFSVVRKLGAGAFVFSWQLAS